MSNVRAPVPHPSPTGMLPALGRDQAGAAAVEMAFVLPILILILCGIVTYGSWLGLAHAVQQSANEAARAGLAGLSQSERATLARTAANHTLARTYDIDPSTVTVGVQDDGATLTVSVAYDASANPMLSMPMIPVASRLISRRTAVKLNVL